MAWEPRTVQCMPERFRRDPTTTLQPASRTPEEVQKCWACNSAERAAPHGLGLAQPSRKLTDRTRNFHRLSHDFSLRLL